MAKSAYEKALEKQTKEAKKQADAAARRERAKSIIDGQPIKNGLRILDGNAEQFLKFILDTYDGGESNRVSVDTQNVPENLKPSISLELEKLQMYGVVSGAQNYISFLDVYLSPKGKTYFEDKEKANEIEEFPSNTVLPRKQYDVFISHASKDKLDYVDGLYLTLRKLGISIFYDSEIISWGDNWKQVILEGTEKSEFAIIVISEQFFGREWTEIELNEFLQKQNESGQKTILPLLHGISIEKLKDHYSDLAEIQSISSERYTTDAIALLLAKELIKRYK